MFIMDLFYDSGVAYSMHIIHLFSYHGGDDLRNHLEVCVESSNHSIRFCISIGGVYMTLVDLIVSD